MSTPEVSEALRALAEGALPTLSTLRANLAEHGLDALSYALWRSSKGPMARVGGTLRRAQAQLTKRPDQLCAQLLGRVAEGAGLDALLAEARAEEGAPWLRPRIPSLWPTPPIVRQTLTNTVSGAPAVRLRFTPDGTALLALCNDGNLLRWRLSDGECASLGHHPDAVDLDVAPDGTSVVSASADDTVRVTPIGGGAPRTLRGHRRAVNCVRITPHGRVISGGADGTLRLWALSTGKPLGTLRAHDTPVRAMALHPDRDLLVSAALDGSVSLWDYRAGRLLRRLAEASEGRRGEAAFFLDEGRVVAVVGDGLRAWRVDDGARVAEVSGRPRGATAAPRGRGLSLAWSDRERVVLGALREDGELVEERWISALQHGASALAVGAKGAVVAAASGERVVLWGVEAIELAPPQHFHTASANGVWVSPDGRFAFSKSTDGTTRQWDMASGAMVRALRTPASSWAEQVRFHPDGRRVVVGHNDGMLWVWDITTGAERSTGWRKRAQESSITAMVLTHDGRHALSGTYQGPLSRWNLDAGGAPEDSAAEAGHVTALALHPDGRWLVSLSYRGPLVVWNATVLQKAWIHEVCGDAYHCALAYLADGRLVTARSDGAVELRDGATGDLLETLGTHGLYVMAVRPLPGDRLWTTARGDGRLEARVWDLREAKVLSAWALPSEFRAVCPLPGEREVAFTSPEGVGVWDLVAGREVAFFATDAIVQDVVPTPDASALVACDQAGRVHILQRTGAHGAPTTPL